jgi:hypothetical protein
MNNSPATKNDCVKIAKCASFHFLCPKIKILIKKEINKIKYIMG